MLATARPQGADLLERALGAATARAQDILGESVSLHHCHDIELRAELDDVVFETSCVSRSNDSLVVAVFASGRDAAGCDGMVAAGHFSFSTFTRPIASIATRLAQWNPGTR
ncbi:hypothetical protein [uncultured Sphingomonas sp.]|uniref:hypothetical protein n=1 Tax=uncultured Sphingomonas sp. TaxID=158754 RepID=UPI0025ECF122|nr:hypothetical protein [uncultured Sphingomonas sp.]